MSKRYDKLVKDEKELEDAFTKANEPEPEPEKEEEEKKEASDKGFKEEPAAEVVPAPEETEEGKQEELPLKIEKEDENSETWKQKYATIEGKYRVEVPRLNQDVKQWKEHAVSLNGKITDLEKALDELGQKTATEEINQDVENISDEYPDISRIIKKLNDDHRAEIRALEQKFTKGMAQEISGVKSDINLSKRERFDMLMRTQGVPDWQAIDTDPRFIEFLNEVPGPYTKKTKLQFLQEAAGEMDVETASKFFLDFKELTKEAPPENRQEKMEKFIAPPKGSAPKAPPGGQKIILTREAYNQFYKDSAKGRFNPKDWSGKTEQQVEDMFDDAIAKGELK